MQVILDIPGDLLRESALETLAALPLEAKQEIVRQALGKNIVEEFALAKNESKAEAVKAFRRKETTGYFHRYRDYTDQQIEADSDFRKWYAENSFTVKDTIIKQVALELTEETKRQVTELVATDPGVQQTIRETVDEVKKALPELVKNALVLHFTKNFAEIANRAYETSTEVYNLKSNMEDLQQKLLGLNN